jgi:hypothetical protein
MKKASLIIIFALILFLNSCKGKYVPGKEFLTNPYAYKNKELTLVLQAKKPADRYVLFSFDWEQPVRIKFENEKDFDFSDPKKFYLITFKCKDGSIYHGNYIIKVDYYYEEKNENDNEQKDSQ